MMHIYEIYFNDLHSYVKFKVLEPKDAELFIESVADYDREDYVKHVLEHIIYNMRTEVVESLKMMSRDDATDMLDVLYNGCIMLNPGLDIEVWTAIAQRNNPCIITIPDNNVFGTDLELVVGDQSIKKRQKPPPKLTKAKFLNLDKHLRERVIGQPEAVDVLTSALKRSHVGLNDENRPLGVFLFAGASGVGKTLLANELHKYLFGEEYDIVRIDCGEYQQKHDAQKLFGSPPGYVGHDDGGQLTNKMIANPYTVVLLDEVEKAHPDVWDAFLRVFDDGTLTDNKGQKADFRNSVVIMTTNLGNDRTVNSLTERSTGFSASITTVTKTKNVPPRDQVTRNATEAIKKQFRPEFLNRIDETIVFNYLTPEDFTNIAELELSVVEDKLAKKGISLNYGEDVIKLLIDTGVDSISGARGLAKVRRDEVETMLAEFMIETRCPRGTIFDLVAQKGHFGLNIRQPKRRAAKGS